MGWVREPTFDLCVRDCGAKCCQGVGGFTMTEVEVQRMADHHRRSEGPLVLYREAPDQIRLNFSDHEGRCPMLAPANTCRIYAERPAACRAFPSGPDPRCAVWPS